MSTLRVAILGFGEAARTLHVPAVAKVPGLLLVGAADPLMSATNVPLFTTAEELLERTRPDLVIVATPPHLHAKAARAALEAGAHVLVEKPFATSLAEVDDLLALATAKQRLLAVNNQYRYMTIYRETARALAAGELGTPYAAQVWQQMNHAPETERNWRADLPRYVLFEFGTHPLDLLAVFFGAHPERVTARTPPVPHASRADVLVTALLEYPGGPVATLHLNRASHAPERYLEMRLDTTEASLRLSFGGVARATVDLVRGRRTPRLRASLVKGGEARVERGGQAHVLSSARGPEQGEATARHLAALAERLRAGDVATSAAEHAREVLRTVFALYRSAATGEAVRVADVGPSASLEAPTL